MSRSAFIQRVIDSAKQNPRNIVLPEGNDERVLEAAHVINTEKIANITLLGDEQKIRDWFDKKSRNLTGITVINPAKSPRLNEFAHTLFELRKHKGLTLEQARELVLQVNYFGMMIMHVGDADGFVSGAAHSTADTVRPALQIIRSVKEGSIVSSFFIMCVNEKPFVFSDCALVENPTAEQLAEIAVQSALSAMAFDIPPHVALLSYSTYGSGSGPMVDKVAKAVTLAKKCVDAEYPNKGIVIDGELQADAAIVPSVAKSKCPNSPLSGQARVLVFPDLNAANISYKLVQRMGGAEAYGPVLQGLNKPVNDLSRGCSVEDIIGTVALTALQSTL